MSNKNNLSATIRHYALLPAWKIRHKVRCVNHLKQQISESSGPPYRIVIGASRTKFSGWISSEKESLNLVKSRTWRRAFPYGSVSHVLLEHVLEHLTKSQAEKACLVMKPFLAPGAVVRIAVPDGGCPDQDYIDYVKPNGTAPWGHDHKVLYTAESLVHLLETAGYETVLREYWSGGNLITSDWDSADGSIMRTAKNIEQPGLDPWSLIVDASPLH